MYVYFHSCSYYLKLSHVSQLFTCVCAIQNLRMKGVFCCDVLFVFQVQMRRVVNKWFCVVELLIDKAILYIDGVRVNHFWWHHWWLEKVLQWLNVCKCLLITLIVRLDGLKDWQVDWMNVQSMFEKPTYLVALRLDGLKGWQVLNWCNYLPRS